MTKTFQPSRRGFLGALSSLSLALVPALPGARLLAQPGAELLPLNTPGIDHLDVMVPDVEAAARFYMSVFNTALHAQPFQGGFRYFVLLGDMPENRQVGYLAIGTSRRGEESYIGHFCTSVFDYRENSERIVEQMRQAYREAGLGEFPGLTGFGGIFADPDGIEIQFLPAPDRVVDAAVPSDLVPANQGLVRPLGVDHVLLQVSDLPRAVNYYRVLYGPEAGHQHNPERVWFDFPSSQLVLEQARYGYGESPRIAHFGIKVEPFDRQQVAASLSDLGAELLSARDEPDVLRFRDPNGIVVELQA